MWPSFYFSSRHHPSIHPFLPSFHFFIRISVFQKVAFCASWAGLVHIATHSCRLFIPKSISPSFMRPYLYFSSRCHPSIYPFSPPLYFSIRISFLNVCFYTSPAGVIHISTHSFCLYTSLSIFLSFMCPYLYFSSRRYPSIHPYSSLVYFSTHILVFQMVIFVLPPSV